jgi:hypothetical protein
MSLAVSIFCNNACLQRIIMPVCSAMDLPRMFANPLSQSINTSETGKAYFFSGDYNSPKLKYGVKKRDGICRPARCLANQPFRLSI